MKNKLFYIVLFSCVISSCQHHIDTDKILPISEIKKTKDGKSYYSVDDKPVTPIGIQIRTDLLIYEENKTFDEIEQYFSLAKEIGATLIEIPVRWKDCEKVEGIYSFKDLGKLLTLADALNLKVEILLFSTNTTGWSESVPDYIKEDPQTYPRYPSQTTPTGLFLKQDDPNLLKKEGEWLQAMMDAIASWSHANGERHVVSAVQIHNESDTFPRFVLSQQNIMTLDGKRKLSDIEAWQETLNAYDYLGKIVKKSQYPCITRVNLAQSYKGSWKSFVKDIFSLEGIDIVGDDTYEKTVLFNKMVIEDFNSEEIFQGNNFPHISENDGSYNTTPSLILGCLAMGGGYMIYDLATPAVAIEQYGWDDWSLVDYKTLQYKDHTELTRKVIQGINSAGSDFVLTRKEDIAAFNIQENIPQEYKKQTIKTSKAIIHFETNSQAMGYAITTDEWIDLFFTAEATISIDNVVYEDQMAIGTIDEEGLFHETEAAITLTDSYLQLEGGKLYRLKVSQIEEPLQSDTVSYIGG